MKIDEVICDQCNGSGDEYPFPCSKCNGEGKVNWIENIFGKSIVEIIEGGSDYYHEHPSIEPYDYEFLKKDI